MTKKRGTLILLSISMGALIVGYLISRSSPPLIPPSTYRLEVKVICSHTGGPLEGVSVGIEGATIGGEGVAENKVTGRDGIATFSLPRGDYIVILEKAGREPKRWSTHLDQNLSVTIDLVRAQ